MGQRLVDIGNRRVAQQIISLVVTGGIGPGEAGDRSGVIRAESAAGLEDEGGLGLAVGSDPAEGDGCAEGPKVPSPVKALKKVPNFKLHSLFLNFNS